MSIKHTKGRRMDAFDWFIGNSLIYFSALQTDSRKFVLESLMARNLFAELARKDLLKKMDTGQDFRILSFYFYFKISLFPLLCRHDLHLVKLVSSTGVGCFISFKKFAQKKNRRIGTGKATLNFHGIFHMDAGKNYSAGEPKSFELFLLFTTPGSFSQPIM